MKAKELRDKGISYTNISKELNVSRRSVINWCK
ncbi:helix-turn-helix domain-containing protein [Acinetobacter baumannii]|nr:helix-turn-helix domain-containing protein [Acinetobacter baumannii]